MCGIAGFIDSTHRSPVENLDRMLASIHYRGPDDSGHFFEKNESHQVGLGHKRLSILDLSIQGRQPMVFADLQMVYNGEVYNFPAIREELERSGYAFETTTDSEIVLKAYHHWGTDAFRRFCGMFALAIYHVRDHTLILARDPVGIKPLYYFLRNGVLLFASELKPLLQHPLMRRDFDFQAMGLYFAHGYIKAPQTIFRDCYKLRPGHWLKYEAGQVQLQAFWDLREKITGSRLKEGNDPQALHDADRLLTEVVGQHMVSDVPFGCFLSGGIDSSLIAALMQKQSLQPIKTFTIGFEEKGFNEAEHARQVSGVLGTAHHEETLSVDDARNLIPSLPDYFDEPFADSSALPTILVSRMARKHVTVCLSGDGGDELFCGYKNYDYFLEISKFKPLSRVLRAADRVLPVTSLLDRIHRRYVKLLFLDRDDRLINHQYLTTLHHLQGLLRSQSLEYDPEYLKLAGDSENLQEAAMFLDMRTYLPDDILTKVDRASMSVSLESRVPLLDHRVVEFSLSLAHAYKYRQGIGKWLLKKLVNQYIPEEIMNRPKQGFAIPIREWLQGGMSGMVSELTAESRIRSQGIFDPHHVTRLVKRLDAEQGLGHFATLNWRMMMFQLWFDKYM